MADKFDILRESQRRMRMDGMGAGPEPLPAEFEDLTEEQLASLPAADVDAEDYRMDKTTSPRAEAGGPGETFEEIDRKSSGAHARRTEAEVANLTSYPSLLTTELQRLVPAAKNLAVYSSDGGEADFDAQAPLLVALHRAGADVDPFVLSVAENMIKEDKTFSDYSRAEHAGRELLED